MIDKRESLISIRRIKKNKKTILFFLVIITFNLLSFSVVVLGSKKYNLGPDRLDDLKTFTEDDLKDIEDNVDIDDIEDMDIDDIKEVFREDIWTQGHYAMTPNYIDMELIFYIIDDDIATLHIQVQEDIKDEDEVLILIWGDCSGECGFMLIGFTDVFFVDEEDIGGNYSDLYEDLFVGINCDEAINGTIDTDENEFMMEIPADWLGKKDCDLFIALITPVDNTNNEKALAMDIWPNEDVEFWISEYDIILFIIVIITFIAIQLYARIQSRRL